MPYFTECVGCGRVQSPESCPEGWVPVEAGAGWLDGDRPLYYPTALLMRCVPCYRKANPGDGATHDLDDGGGGRYGAQLDGLAAHARRSERPGAPRPDDGPHTRDGRQNATLKRASDASFSSLNAANLVVDQAGETVTVALATNVPYQDNVSGTSTTPGLVLVSFHDRLGECARDRSG